MNKTLVLQLIFSLLVTPVLAFTENDSDPAELESSKKSLPIEQIIEKAYVWGWPMVYLSNMRKSLRFVRGAGVSGGAPVAPINRLSMLTAPVTSEMSAVPCPNPDLIYGFAMLDLTEQPVILQVPQATDRVWVIQVGDHRTDSIGNFGSMYETEAGFYAIVGPDWKGDLPASITGVVRSTTNLAYVLPRYLSHGPTEKLSEITSKVAVYPLDQYNGKWKCRDWSNTRWYPQTGESTREKSRFVNPESFFNDLEVVLDQVPPLAGEEELYEQLRSLMQLKQASEQFSADLIRHAHELEQKKIVPMFDFNRVGHQVSNNWTTINNGARFGTDFQTRTAVAKSNTFVNRPQEAKYFHVEVDNLGRPLDSSQSYQVTFSADELPPNDGFWSLTIYDRNHRLISHPSQKSSVIGLPSKFQRSADGSVTIVIQKDQPIADNINWLPAGEGHFVLYLRVYAPKQQVIEGSWVPPGVEPTEGQLPSLVTAKPSMGSQFE